MSAKKSVSYTRPLAHPIALETVAFYYEAPNAQPDASLVAKGIERVEIVTGGRGWVSIENEWVEVTAGALLWHVEGDSTIARSDGGNPYRCVNIQMLMSRRDPRRRAPRLSRWGDIAEVEQFANKAIRSFVDDAFDPEALLAYVYGRLIFQVRLSERVDSQSILPGPIRQALHLIDTRYHEPLPIRQIASVAGWSTAHFHEVFQRHIEVSPHQALLLRRLQRARELLSSTDLSIKQVASECGFSTAAGFGHTFRSRVGLTPRAFRIQATGR